MVLSKILLGVTIVAMMICTACESREASLQSQVDAQATRIAELEVALAPATAEVPPPIVGFLDSPPTETPTATPTATPTETPIPTPTPVEWEQYGFHVSGVGGRRTYTVQGYQGGIIAGYFTIADGRQITFWINDPFGKTIHNPGIVWARHDFSVRCTTTGAYELVFDNCFTCVGRTISLNWHR